MADEVLTFKRNPVGTVKEAAEAAAEVYAPAEINKQRRVILEAVEARLKEYTKRYVKRAMKAHREGPPEELEMAEAIGPVYPPYPYWDLFLAGPFQPLGGGAAGPFLPQKIIRADDPAFMTCHLWRNPECINWACPAPSACEMMSGWTATVWLRTTNFTKTVAGPAFGPFEIKLPNYPDCIYSFDVPLDGSFPVPPNGAPDLYEVNATVDITGPGAVSFAGYATWMFDPDTDPLWWFFPEVGPQYQYDVPVRLLVYTK
jgi:hypothetical protein